MSETAATILNTLIEVQGWIRAELAAYLDAFASTSDWTWLIAVLPVGVFFGAVHALTPGHGKIVLSSYLIGSRLNALRSTLVAGALASTHVASAVIVALAASYLVTRTIVGVGRAPILEDISRGLIIALGLWLVVRAVWGNSHEHREGIAVGIMAGLVPCPLTFFAMVLALSRGTPEAGLAFAAAMLVGVGLTLSLVAIGTALARDVAVKALAERGASFAATVRVLEAASGVLLIGIALAHFLG